MPPRPPGSSTRWSMSMSGCRGADASRAKPAISPTTHARRGLVVRGVMGYEGHLMAVPDRTEQRAKVAESMEKLVVASLLVGGDIISAGGTGTLRPARSGDRDTGRQLRADGHALRRPRPPVPARRASCSRQ